MWNMVGAQVFPTVTILELLATWLCFLCLAIQSVDAPGSHDGALLTAPVEYAKCSMQMALQKLC